MNFADQLRAAKGDLTARQVAEAIDADLSHRTVEDWLAGRREPAKWERKLILGKLANVTGKPPVETWDGCQTPDEIAEYAEQEIRAVNDLRATKTPRR